MLNKIFGRGGRTFERGGIKYDIAIIWGGVKAHQSRAIFFFRGGDFQYLLGIIFTRSGSICYSNNFGSVGSIITIVLRGVEVRYNNHFGMGGSMLQQCYNHNLGEAWKYIIIAIFFFFITILGGVELYYSNSFGRGGRIVWRGGSTCNFLRGRIKLHVTRLREWWKYSLADLQFKVVVFEH